MRMFHYPLMVAFVFAMALAGCTQPAAPPLQPPAPAREAATRPEWQQRWDDTLAAARKEGKLAVYGGINPAAVRALTDAFRQKYGIELDFLIGRGSEIAVKYKTEQSAGINIPGAFTMSPSFQPQGFFAPIEPYLVLPEVKDPKAWLGGRVPYMDEEKTMIMLNRGYTSYTAVNTDMVKEGQIKSLPDLLKPEWKGKVTLFYPGMPSAAAAWATFVLTKAYDWQKGTDYLRQFAATAPVITQNAHQHVEWIARGKYAVAIGAQQAATTDFIKAGAPVGIIRWQEGGMINTASGNLEVPHKPANPNAATVFINWLLTKEGQTIFAGTFGNPSWRADVSTAEIDPSRIPLPGEKLFADDLEFYEQQAKAMQLARQIFAAPAN